MEVSKTATALPVIYSMYFAPIQATIPATLRTGHVQAAAVRLMFAFSIACPEPVPQLLTDYMVCTWEIIFATPAHKPLMIPRVSQ